MLKTLLKHKYTQEQMQSLIATAINEISSGLVISDYTQPDNPLIFVNPAFEKMTGYSQEEVLGKNCRFLQGEMESQPELDLIREAVKLGKNQRVVLKNFRKNGQMFWNELIISPVHDSTGAITNFIGIQTDVTDRVEAQQALKERTRELENSNRDLEQFGHAVSHDLKEPLRMISTFIEYLSEDYEDKLDAQAKEYIHYALNGAQRMQTLIEDLFDYSKVSAKTLDYEAFDLSELLAEVLVNLKILIDERSVDFSSDKLPTVIGIRAQFVTLLQNLINNAIKYTEKDKIPVIKLSYKDIGDSHLLEFKDNGIGIDPHYQEYVFEIFNRLHSKKTYPGNGVGLAMCKRIIERHKGKIWFESNEEKGTKFFIQFPKDPNQYIQEEK